MHDLQQPRPLEQRLLACHKHGLALHHLAALDLLEVVLLERRAGRHEVQDDVRRAHHGRRLQRAVRSGQLEVLEALLGEVLLRQVQVARQYPQGPLLGPAHVLEVLQRRARVPRVGHGNREVALAKVESVVDDEEVLVPLAQLREHVVPDDAQVDVAVADLAYDVGGALEPHLEVVELGHLCYVLPGVHLAHLELARREQVLRVLSHAALGRDA
mmetsp:Transcript_23815/g.81176  ORF Transcript_23815/g.81176 Transcript_23815/m.81176 type:complete len:214 (+) Transcript_23815:537-1178(+)